METVYVENVHPREGLPLPATDFHDPRPFTPDKLFYSDKPTTPVTVFDRTDEPTVPRPDYQPDPTTPHSRVTVPVPDHPNAR